MVDYHLAVDCIAYLNIVLLSIVYCYFEDFIICKAVITTFLHLVYDVCNAVGIRKADSEKSVIVGFVLKIFLDGGVEDLCASVFFLWLP